MASCTRQSNKDSELFQTRSRAKWPLAKTSMPTRVWAMWLEVTR